MIFDKSQAILRLRPGAQFNMRNGVIEWLSQDMKCPSDAEITECIKTYIPALTLEERIVTLESKVSK